MAEVSFRLSEAAPLPTSGGYPLSASKISQVHTDLEPSGQPKEGSSLRRGLSELGHPLKAIQEHTAFIMLSPHTCSRPRRQSRRPRCCRAGAAAADSPCTEAAPCPPSLKVKGDEENRGRKAKPHPGAAGRNRVTSAPAELSRDAPRPLPTRDGGPSAPPPHAAAAVATSPPRRSGTASAASSPLPGRNPLPPAWSLRGRSRGEGSSSAGGARNPPVPAGAAGGVCRAGAPPCPAEFASTPPLPLGEESRDRLPRRSRSGGPASPFPAGAGWRRALALTVRERRLPQPSPAWGPCPHPTLPEGFGDAELP